MIRWAGLIVHAGIKPDSAINLVRIKEIETTQTKISHYNRQYYIKIILSDNHIRRRQCFENTEQTLTVVNRTIIKTYGSAFITINISLLHFTYDFVIADVERPIIYTDFHTESINRPNLLEDIKYKSLLEDYTKMATQTTFEQQPPLVI